MKDDIKKTRKRLEELKEMHLTGFLDDAQYAEAVAHLERKLIDAVMSDPITEIKVPVAAQVDAPRPEEAPLKPPRARPAKWPWFGAIAVVFVLAVAGAGWKFSRGRSDSSISDIVRLSASQRQAMTPEQLGAAAGKLAKRVEDQPNDADAWAALARIDTTLNRHAKAALAYEKAVALRNTDAGLLAELAEARATINNGSLSGEPTELIQRALALEPANAKALSLAATAAFERKDYAAAVAYWDKIIEISPDGALAQKARGLLADVRQLAAAAPAGASTSASGTAASGTEIRGTVSLSPELSARVSSTDTLFVYARAVDGPLPLAVIRKQVKDLPLEFKLDDSMAMWPSAKVSTASQVVVTARISKSGEGQPKNGDLQGQSQPVVAGASGLQIEIDAVIKK